MARKKPNISGVIVCDDIREELHNKKSLIGIYGDKIFLPYLPFVFPKFCIYIQCYNVLDGDSLRVEIQDPKDKVIANSGETKVNAPKGKKGYSKIDLGAIFSPLKISEDGTYNIRIVFNGDDKSAISYKVHITTNPK